MREPSPIECAYCREPGHEPMCPTICSGTDLEDISRAAYGLPSRGHMICQAHKDCDGMKATRANPCKWPGAVQMSACACGHSCEEHGHDDKHPGSMACTECECIAFEEE